MPASKLKRNEARKRWRYTQDPGIFCLTVLSLIVLGVYTYYTRQLVLSTHDAANKQLRAYVFTIPGNIYNVGLHQSPEPRTIIRNGGQTFAREVRRYVGVKVSVPLSPEQEAGLGYGAPEEGTLILGPNGADDIIIRRGEPIEEETAEQIRAQKLRLYVFGRIEYKDMFDRPHWTDFCYFYAGEMTDWGLQRGGMGYNNTQARYCTGHNDTDRGGG